MAVLVKGRLSIREDEDIKLTADIVVPLETPGREKEPPKDPAALAKQAPVKLYLRLKRSQMQDCEEKLRKMRGDVPVYLNLPDEGVTLLAPMSWWCDDADDAKANLLGCLPAENMKVVWNE